MRIGISRPPTPEHPVPDVDGALVAKHAERIGFESVFYGEHPIRPVNDPGRSVHARGVPFFQDTLVMLARASAMTTTLTVGGGVFLIPEHNPFRFAKELASLDLYSGGRVVVGAGIGWSPTEVRLLGGDFEHRWGQTRECVEIMKRLWTGEPIEYTGRFYSAPPVQCFPKPATPGGPPVLIGVRSGRVFERIAAYADGWLPAFVTREDMANGPGEVRAGRKRIADLAEAAGRDPAKFQTTAIIRGEEQDGGFRPEGAPNHATRDLVEQFEEAGADRVLISMRMIESEQDAIDELERIAAAVL